MSVDESHELDKEKIEKLKKEEEFLEYMKEEFARRIGYQKRLDEKFGKERNN